nr:MAG TPA: hypothetical protein [Ackermannviridae sp.]
MGISSPYFFIYLIEKNLSIIGVAQHYIVYI